VKLATLAYVKRHVKRYVKRQYQDVAQTLMLHKQRPGDYHEGKWNGLGGKFEEGESPEACLLREVYEESGLTATQATLRGVITFPDFDGVDDWYTFVYTVEGFSGVPRSSAEGQLHWIDDADVPNLNVWEGDRIFLPWLHQPQFFSAVFRYQQGVFQDYDVVFYGACAAAKLPAALKVQG
jgi:8-oxo-dGTP diphosphatase